MCVCVCVCVRLEEHGNDLEVDSADQTRADQTRARNRLSEICRGEARHGVDEDL